MRRCDVRPFDQISHTPIAAASRSKIPGSGEPVFSRNQGRTNAPLGHWRDRAEGPLHASAARNNRLMAGLASLDRIRSIYSRKLVELRHFGRGMVLGFMFE